MAGSPEESVEKLRLCIKLQRHTHKQAYPSTGIGKTCGTNLEVANKLTGVLQYTPATQSVADYTSNQHTAAYHKEVK